MYTLIGSMCAIVVVITNIIIYEKLWYIIMFILMTNE